MTNLSAEALRELKEKAEKATPGPWAWDGCVWDYDEEQESPWLVQNHGSQSPVIEGALHAEQTDATYIAAASPDVILALLAERERLRTENEAIRLANVDGKMWVDSTRDEMEWLRKDAARYQWLKAWQKTDGFDDAAIDREIAIDAAIAAAGEE